MQAYDYQKIEKKWQDIWDKYHIYKTEEISTKPKFYVLDMFPYPSGAGLHVGHPKGYIATDIVARMKMMEGYNVLHPMGWDAFGLPAENYAIEHKIHPRIAVQDNINRFKEQLRKIGFTYDWSREINTTDPEYYKWTQWIFLQMYKKGLAYLSDEPVNWCPHCKTVLANEEVIQGKCERCGTPVIKKRIKEWVLKMTAYADRLLKGLKTLNWEKSIIEQQKNWIGRSEGAEIKFMITGSQLSLDVFTTRLDTIFGCTYVVIAPEHKIISSLRDKITNIDEVDRYIEIAQNKSDLERTDLAKEKSGKELKGIKAINPFTKEEVSVFVSDYVLPYYGTGAIMAVPAHDERDFEFAKKYNLPIKEVIRPVDSHRLSELPFVEDGILINSGKFNGLTSSQARKEILEFGEKNKFARKAVHYKMHDWVFSRQRYWGEPFPIVYCRQCYLDCKHKDKLVLNKDYTVIDGKEYMIVPVPEKDLPVKLPEVKKYEPTGTTQSPLANIKNWIQTKCPVCGKPALREANTMPQWAGSCWYYLRYIDPHNDKELVSFEKQKYWLPVDLYVGGAEHATRHLLYARFWHKFLYDIGVVSTKEPFKELKHVGLILAEDGRKMSKRWKNVVNPDDIVRDYGADALRLYEMFMGPFDQPVAWSTKGVVGMKRFLDRVWDFYQSKIALIKSDTSIKENQELEKLVHQTIKKVTNDINDFRFNVAISQLMVLANKMREIQNVTRQDLEIFLKLLSPFAPHICEELWQNMKQSPESHFKSIFQEKWPQYNKEIIQDEKINFIIQINGKFRDKFISHPGITQEEAKRTALQSDRIKKWIKGKKILKVIFVSDKLINIVTQD